MEISGKPTAIRLSVIDDHPVVFLGVRMALRKCKTQSIVFVNQYINGTSVINDLANLNSDVVLIDLFLPDTKGYDLARKILEVYPDIKIGIYSSMLEKDAILTSFKSGALGYLPKTAPYEELVDFILTISKGERYVRGVIADIIFANENAPKPLIDITKRESEILQLIFDGCKNREIAEKLNIAERTVEFHRQNIYLKFNVTNSVDLYKTALQLNLIPEKWM
jgi:DNA-binding NarL/FixJ family response regulator